ncbi:MAG: hypothetical protein P8I38_13675 [Arenicella sp.]|nr:hypothetical protein [Arenicella sp.]
MNDTHHISAQHVVKDWFSPTAAAASSSSSAETFSHLIAVSLQLLKEHKILIILLTILGGALGVLKAL